MYKEHVPLIKQYAESPSGLLDVITFVLLTIRTPFYRVKDQLKDVRLTGAQSAALWGFKRSGYSYAREHLEALYRASQWPTEDALDEYLKVPGLGLAKAGFTLQCLGHDIACLDTHNIKRFNLNTTIIKKKDGYMQVCKMQTTEQWWDSWCEYLVNTAHNKGKFKDAYEVSQFHLECIVNEK